MTVCENADERRQRLPKILVSDLQRPLGSDFDSQDYEENGQRRDVTSKVTEAYPHGLDTPSPLKPLGKATEHQRKHTKSSSLGTSMSSSKAPDDDPNPIRDTPIPWDDPGSQRRIPVSDSQLSSKFHQSLPSESASPTPNAIAANNIQFGERSNDDSLSWPTTNSPGTIHAAKQVIEQAHSNSTHTDVTETLAPGKFLRKDRENGYDSKYMYTAVVHETFRQDTHQIRQEVITREIHNHDYYHRVLPIVDVEVLPARHFLPVEGGGLVEISADEVPGRGRHWVVAETASRIPSDQPAPQAINRFSARKFTGSEGDFKKYITPEGYERTEETWVHPPELETGARDTGQTWPLVLGGEPDQNIHGRFGSPSKRQSKKPRRVAVESEKTV